MEQEGNQVLYQGIRFNIEQLRGMIYRLVEEARQDLIELIMLEMNVEGEVKEGQLPLIDQERLSNNPSEEKVRQLFLKDVQNKFAVDRKWWLLKRIAYELRLQGEWFEDVEGDYLY